MVVFLLPAPNVTSSSTSAGVPTYDDASMTCLGAAEAIIEDEVGRDQLNVRQDNQLDAFKVRLLYTVKIVKFR